MNDELIAGDTLDFLDSVPEYPPADGWTLKYQLIPRFTSPVQAAITLTASTSGSDYRVQAAAAVTATWAPGAYTWARWVEKAGPIRQSLGSGQLTVKQDPSTAAQGYDSRSHVRKQLDQIEAAIEALQLGVQAYTISTRSFTSRDLPELLDTRDRYRREVAQEDAEARLASGQQGGRRLFARL